MNKHNDQNKSEYEQAQQQEQIGIWTSRTTKTNENMSKHNSKNKSEYEQTQKQEQMRT
jgi:hypothetical protein